MGPKTRRDQDDDEVKDSGEAFQNDLDDLYGTPDDEDDTDEDEE